MNFTGTNGGDQINGTAGDDTILGLGGHDNLLGLAGNDSLNGGDGFDTLDGGLGDDVLTGGGLGDWFRFILGTAVDPTTGQSVGDSFGDDTITDFGASDYLVVDTSLVPGGVTFDGFEQIGDDTVLRFGVGTAQESSITLLNYALVPGDFTQSGSVGTLYGNIQSVISHDDLVGTAGSDILDGFAGDDTLQGLGSSDQLFGGDGDDTVFGGADDDDLWGDSGNDTLDGGAGSDEIHDGNGNDIVLGGSGNDQITIVEGSDTITTGPGDDGIEFRMEMVTDPATGQSTLRGFGHNVITDFKPGDVLSVEAGDYSGPNPPVEGFEIVGTDTILRFATGSDQESTITILNYHVPMDEFHGANSHYLTLEATEAGLLNQDHLIGSDTEYDELRGYGGNDTLEGLALDDDLFGGAGDDTMFGGADRDWVYSGTGNDVAYGGDGRDVLQGEAGDNTLIGGQGDDELISGTGNDLMTGEAGGDVYRLEMLETYNEQTGTYSSAGFGHDTITDFSVNDQIYVETYAWDGTGNAFSSLEFVGSDTILRWAVGTPQESSLTIKNYHLPASEIDEWDDFMSFYFEPAYYESPLNEIYGTSNADNLLGTVGDDLLVGWDSSDNLAGAAGNDTLEPGAGGAAVQNLYGQTGDDTYLIDADSGRIRISTWAEKDGWGDDRVVFRDLTLADVSVTTYDSGDADGERLVIAWNQDGVSGEVTMAHTGSFIESIEFADGQVWDPAQLVPGRIEISGTELNDTLRGTNYDEILSGGDGTDHLQAAGGDDILDPGSGAAGIQYLYGQQGNDTYRIGRDVGLARINIWAEHATSGTMDIVQFTDLNAEDLTVEQFQGPGADGLEMRLTWNLLGVSGELQIAHEAAYIEAFQFANGDVLTADDLLGA